MKQFNLEEYLKNPSRKVVTRGGRPVRIVCTDFGNEFYPIIGELQDEKYPTPKSFTDKGKFFTEINREDELDLFFAPEKHEGWINLYKSGINWSLGASIWQTQDLAKEYGMHRPGYVDTIKIEWEE